MRDWTQVSRAIDEHSNHHANVQYVCVRTDCTFWGTSCNHDKLWMIVWVGLVHKYFWAAWLQKDMHYGIAPTVKWIGWMILLYSEICPLNSSASRELDGTSAFNYARAETCGEVKLNCFSAEMLYGTTLHIPSQFFLDWPQKFLDITSFHDRLVIRISNLAYKLSDKSSNPLCIPETF